MRLLRTLLMIVGMISIVMIMSPIQGWTLAPTQCFVENDIRVDAQLSNNNGRTQVTYSMTELSGNFNVNKFFAYTRRDLAGDLQVYEGEVALGKEVGSYLSNGVQPNLPQSVRDLVWATNLHNDGWLVPQVAVDKTLVFDVSYRALAELGETTLILSFKNDWALCGPILGVNTPAGGIANDPVTEASLEQTFRNGCTYRISYDRRTKLITGIEALNQIGTVEPDDCTDITFEAGICEKDTGHVHCSIARVGDDPLQTVPGGTCYYPTNIKFNC